MRTLIRSLALLAALLPAIAAAQVPNTPQTLPANTVVGRLGVTPGPAQAIPFSRFQSAVSGPCATASAGLVPATGGGTANFLRADCTFANPNPAIANNNLLANISGGSAAPVANTPSGLWNSFCSTTIGNFWVRLSSAWGCVSLGYANPVWWGADPTGASDSAAAINSAIATGLPVRLPGGTFKVLSVTTWNLANGVACACMEGAGNNSTHINWPNASGGITVNAANLMNNFIFRNLHLTTTQANSGTALNLIGFGTGSAPWSLIDNLSITGDDYAGTSGAHYWATGINIKNWGDITVLNTNYYGLINGTVGGGVGLAFAGNPATSSYATVLNVIGGSYNFGRPGITLGSYWQGVSFTNINCNGGTSGNACIQQQGSATGVLALLYVVGSQMNVGGNQLDINTAIDGITLIGNTGITCSTNNCAAAALGPSIYNVIEGNSFTSFGSPTGTTGVLLNGASNVVMGNFLNGLATGINLQAGATNTLAALNTYVSVTTKITNSGGATNSVGTAAAGNMTGVVP